MLQKKKDLPAYVYARKKREKPVKYRSFFCKFEKRKCFVYLLIYLCCFLFSINQVDSCGKVSSTPKCCFRYPEQIFYISLLNMILQLWFHFPSLFNTAPSVILWLRPLRVVEEWRGYGSDDPVVGGFCKVMKI